MEKFNTFHFKGQKADETIILVIRRHWFDVLQQLFIIFLMLAFLFGSFIYLPILFPILTTANMHDFFMFLANFFAMMIWILFFLVWIDYYFDVWIITTKRIVNINQRGLFSRMVSELELEKIQDITTDVKGVIPTFLNFGNVYIQTAGKTERFIFQSIPDPYAIKDLIMNLEDKKEKIDINARAKAEAIELKNALK